MAQPKKHDLHENGLSTKVLCYNLTWEGGTSGGCWTFRWCQLLARILTKKFMPGVRDLCIREVMVVLPRNVWSWPSSSCMACCIAELQSENSGGGGVSNSPCRQGRRGVHIPEMQWENPFPRRDLMATGECTFLLPRLGSFHSVILAHMCWEGSMPRKLQFISHPKVC